MRNLLTLLHRSVLRDPHHDALWWKEEGRYRSMTYSDLWEQVQAFAYGLQTLGTAPTSKVAILAHNSPSWTIGDLGILMLGAVTVPIYPTSTVAQIEYLLQNADVEIVIVENKELLDRVRSAKTDAVRHLLLMQPNAEPDAPEVLSFASILERGRAVQQSHGPLWSWQLLDEETLATIVHTSGTTGHPKGVMLTHGNILHNIEATLAHVPVDPTDRTLSYLPLSHIFERTCGQFAVLVSGATMAYAEDLSTISQNLLEVRPTMMTSVPRLFEKIYDGVQQTMREGSALKRGIFRMAVRVGKRQVQRPTRLTQLWHGVFDRLVWKKIREKTGGRLRLLVSGGAALHPAIAEFFLMAGLPICEGYGMTETAPVIANNPTHAMRLNTVGRVLANLDVKIAPDGEILVKGPSVMVGYYKNPEATAEAFDEEGYLRTGDIGELDGGYLRVVERKKNILVLATGKNVAPFPIESALMMSPYISQAVLFGDRRKYVSALLVPDLEQLAKWAVQQGFAPHTLDLLQHPAVQSLYEREIHKRLDSFAPFEIPKKFTLLAKELTQEDGELTATLKVRTHVLEERYRAAIEAMYKKSSEHPDKRVQI